MLARDVFHCTADEVLDTLSSEEMTEWYAILKWDEYGKDAPDIKAQFDSLFTGAKVV